MSNRHDWDAIERDYRTGQFSLRELSAKHGISHTAIAKRAKEKGWLRDLSDDVRRETNARLIDATAKKSAEAAGDADEVSTGVYSEVYSGNPGSQEAVRAAGKANAEIVLGHRKNIKRIRLISERHLELLEAMLKGNEAEREQAITRLCISRGDGVTSHLKAAIDLVDRIIRLERQAFGLDESDQRSDLERAEAVKEQLRLKLISELGSSEES